MAWIKMRAGLTESPAFVSLRSTLGCSTADLMLALFRAAEWFEAHARWGQMDDRLVIGLDAVTGLPGLYREMVSIGWIKKAGGKARLLGFCSPGTTRKGLGVSVRGRVLAAGACASCGAMSDLVIDHIVPVCLGGSGEPENLQCLCATCNRAKGRMTMAAFMAKKAGG